jgi:hypothetical protein
MKTLLQQSNRIVQAILVIVGPGVGDCDCRDAGRGFRVLSLHEWLYHDPPWPSSGGGSV